MDAVSESTEASSVAIRLGKDEEQADCEETIRNFTGAAYKGWPNEACFEGLTEERGPIEITVSGHIPQSVAGSLYRTGPGVCKVEDTPKGTYYISHCDQMMEHIRKQGDGKFFSFGQRSDPCLGLFSKIITTWQASTVRQENKVMANVNVTVFPDFPGLVEYTNFEIIHSLYYDVLLQRNGADRAFWGTEQRARSVTHLARYSFRVSLDKSRPTSNPGAIEPATKVFSIPVLHCGELPTINPRFATRRHRYVYGLPSWGRSTRMDGIVKTDTLTREALFWDVPRGHMPGEAIFVPRPGAAEEDEDDGFLLSVVLDGHSRKSYLLCLDARTMTEMGRAEVGSAVALRLHGVHLSG
ncbi:hypothetical protein VTK56DRAFT_4083 [Thermocarpiscus australiensis]